VHQVDCVYYVITVFLNLNTKAMSSGLATGNFPAAPRTTSKNTAGAQRGAVGRGMTRAQHCMGELDLIVE
jgi:hypothetical protein